MMRRHISLPVIAALALVVLACSATAEREENDFGAHWHDGKAELDGYKLNISRYGQERDGYAVMIFVTEPFSESERVKVNDYRKTPSFDALKLNLVRHFQTGVYDYDTMVSIFVRSADFSPVKLTFSSAEWCGHVYLDLIVDPGHIQGHYSSYFEGESGPVDLKGPKDGVLEDELFILLRGLRADYLQPGQSVGVDYLPGALYTRFAHQPLEWTTARISRARDTEPVEVAAGSFECMVYTVEIGDGRDGTFWIESEYPHRIVKWSLPPDVSGELTGSARMPYWDYNREGDESHLRELGLSEHSE
jgi:hypothetical protein